MKLLLQVLPVPKYYLRQHQQLLNEFQNSTHWPKHLLVQYHWRHNDALNVNAALYVLFGVGKQPFSLACPGNASCRKHDHAISCTHKQQRSVNCVVKTHISKLAMCCFKASHATHICGAVPRYELHWLHFQCVRQVGWLSQTAESTAAEHVGIDVAALCMLSAISSERARRYRAQQ